MKHVIAYIDAFNFYFGMTRGTKYKWCDLFSLCKKLVPEDELIRVKVFSGRAKVLSDPQQPMRQQIYFRALESNNDVEVIKSPFHINKKRLPHQTWSIFGRKLFFRVLSPQEKGSDVKLATHLLMDGMNNKYDLALVITNDSDLEEPIRVVRKELRKRIMVAAPTKGHMADKLKKAAGGRNHRTLPMQLVIESQFPDQIIHKGKRISKPDAW